MSTTTYAQAVSSQAGAWDEQLAAIEAGLTQLDEAFAAGQPELVEASALVLQQCLAQATQVLRREPGRVLTPELAQRLTLAQARARSHQAAVTRGRVATERTLQVLMGPAPEGTYQALGQRPGALSAYR